MSPPEETVRTELLGRRERLVSLAARQRSADLVELLRLVDTTLERLDAGSWGICTVCHDPVEEDRLAADPLISICLGCLSPAQLTALERDLETAARVQGALVPPPEIEHAGWHLAVLREPLGPVSGDHVDLMVPRAEDEPLHLLLGDVVGKGVAASLLQTHLHALFRALAGPDDSLEELLGRVNRLFSEATGTSSYATLIAAHLFPDGRIRLANAGHPPPLLADHRGVRPVEGSDLPLGLFSEAAYASRELTLAPGQTLLLYTDGLTEASRDDEEYGLGRAAAALRRAAHHAPSELIAACRDDVETFLAGAERHDDLTLLVARRTG